MSGQRCHESQATECAAIPPYLPTLFSQCNYDEADPLYLRALEINKEALGPDHPDVAMTLNNRAMLLEEQVKTARRFLKAILLRLVLPVNMESTGISLTEWLLFTHWITFIEPDFECGDNRASCGASGPSACHPGPHPHLCFSSSQGRHTHADVLYASATEILEKDPDQNRLQLLITLNNRVKMLESQARVSPKIGSSC